MHPHIGAAASAMRRNVCQGAVPNEIILNSSVMIDVSKLITMPVNITIAEGKRGLGVRMHNSDPQDYRSTQLPQLSQAGVTPDTT